MVTETIIAPGDTNVSDATASTVTWWSSCQPHGQLGWTSC